MVSNDSAGRAHAHAFAHCEGAKLEAGWTWTCAYLSVVGVCVGHCDGCVGGWLVVVYRGVLG